MNSILQDLTCPITYSTLEDPITVPCCGKAFSRTALVSSLGYSTDCPMCHGDLSNFDARNAAKNVVIAALIDAAQGHVPIPETRRHEWSATLTPISDDIHSQLRCESLIRSSATNLYQFTLSLDEARFTTRPSLFIVVCDHSGSMQGSPWNQVETALLHIAALQKHNESVRLVIIGYGSDAQIVNTSGTYEDIVQNIKTMNRGGGTNFRNAFHKIKEVLAAYTCSNDPNLQNSSRNVCSATVAFLTDGQDMSGNKDRLIPEFTDMMGQCWDHPLSVHAIGFSGGCDKDLLESMRNVGSIPGTFRYAEPGDDEDALCNKLTGVFEFSSKASSVPVTLEISDFSFRVPLEMPIHFPIDHVKHGEYKTWVIVKKETNPRLKVSSNLDVSVDVIVERKSSSVRVNEEWFSTLTDELATDVLTLSKETLTPDIKVLSCALLQQRADSIQSRCPSDRLDFLSEQIKALKKGEIVNVGKVSDLRFGSMFGTTAKTQIRTIPPPQPKMIEEKPYFEQPLRKYNRNIETPGRSELQRLIMDHYKNTLPDLISSLINTNNALQTDEDGNNALHLAAYCGHSEIVKAILARCEINLESENNHEETAVTLAIKKRGFHYTLKNLLDAGAVIPRPKPLERYAIDNAYSLTAEVISRYGDGSNEVDMSMTPEYVKFIYNRVKDSGEFNTSRFLDVVLAKNLKDLAALLLEKHGATPTIDMLLDHCIPPKPDHPETEKYLDLTNLLLKHKPDLIKERNKTLETPLFRAAERGSLPHVELFLGLGVPVDLPNDLGNTPLWIATFKAYPCIMTFLLDHGADVNYQNLKGNPPIYGTCMKGPLKIAEMLLARGADLEKKNQNGDTMVLLACRNGQDEVLKLFLDYVEPEFVDFKADIDGFNAILSSAEANRPECIRVLFEYGIDINQTTDDDNPILSRATPMHIAAYYGRTEALQKLLQLGANPNARDVNGQTPLHIAVIQGNIPIIKALRLHTDTSIEDDTGNSAMTYCRNREEIRDIMVDPALDILMKLAMSGFSKEDEKVALALLYSNNVPTIPLSIDVQDYDGSTPLLQAVVHSAYDVAKCLAELGGNPLHTNNQGMNSVLWAMHLRNPRMQKLFLQRDFTQELQRLRHEPKLFLGKKPEWKPPTSSTINHRMEEFINAVLYTKRDLNPTPESPQSNEYHTFYAKVFTTGLVAQGSYLSLDHLLSLYMYTLNTDYSHEINVMAANCEVNQTLQSAVSFLPIYMGEVFIGSEKVDRRLFPVDKEFSWATFMSGSTLWRVATVENFARGTVFIVKSKTGRFVGKYSKFSFDAEVIFTPGIQFRVTNWYRGDVICLGQANIREHTFYLEDEDKTRLMENNKPLIIEIEEI